MAEVKNVMPIVPDIVTHALKSYGSFRLYLNSLQSKVSIVELACVTLSGRIEALSYHKSSHTF